MLGGMLAATPLAVIFVPVFFVVILSIFKTKPKLLGAQPAHPVPTHALEAPPAGPGGSQPTDKSST